MSFRLRALQRISKLNRYLTAGSLRPLRVGTAQCAVPTKIGGEAFKNEIASSRICQTRVPRNDELGFTLIEVLITVAVVSTAVVFILRSFTTLFAATKFSQDMTFACFLAEDKLGEIELRYKDPSVSPLEIEGTQDIGTRHFSWRYQAVDPGLTNLKRIDFECLWKENAKEKEHSLDLSAYLASS